MIELKPFTESDFETFKSWIHSEEELFQFAGPLIPYPVTNESLMKYIQMTDRKPMKVVLNSTNETIGHCELNFMNGQNRLSRILIGSEELRGKGIGEQIVRKMLDLLFSDSKVKAADLNVFSWNKAAIKCYEKVGFRIIHEHTDQMNVNGKDWTRLNMLLERHDYDKLEG
ncbi:GNAT family N-acetyltransferase [Brumimicrobium oceani]|uniref:N-acetyltransferase n=1 Tax=Brumimicrobium oceani TaxID=2100725 RepID=A0A2U2XGW0_9FLAO|nr:GNAT family protein [Brumimicrobium oceani]PWH87003.1 N-acetyltransferase [Brumimicrobium oceani]